jgi:hypothetical protein
MAMVGLSLKEIDQLIVEKIYFILDVSMNFLEYCISIILHLQSIGGSLKKPQRKAREERGKLNIVKLY